MNRHSSYFSWNSGWYINIKLEIPATAKLMMYTSYVFKSDHFDPKTITTKQLPRTPIVKITAQIPTVTNVRVLLVTWCGGRVELFVEGVDCNSNSSVDVLFNMMCKEQCCDGSEISHNSPISFDDWPNPVDCSANCSVDYLVDCCVDDGWFVWWLLAQRRLMVWVGNLVLLIVDSWRGVFEFAQRLLIPSKLNSW